MSNGCGGPPIVFTTCPRPKKSKSKKCSSQGSRKKVCAESNGGSNGNCAGGEKKKSFMEEMWKAMTPDLLNKLVDILVEEFNMTREEACEFVRTQKELSKKSQKAASGKCPCNDMAPAIPNIDVRNAMIKEFVEVTACKLSDFMSVLLCARRTKRQKILNETMLESLNNFVGPNHPDSPVSKITTFLAEKMSLWLDSLFDDVCSDDKNKEGNDDNDEEAAPAPEEEPPPPEEE